MFSSGSTPFTMPVVPAGYQEGGSGSQDGWGDGGWLWIIVVFALLFGWGNNGFGGGAGSGGAGLQGALTRGDLCQDMNFSDLENGVRGIQQGLCDGFYAMNTSMLDGFSGVQQTMCAGFNGITNTMNQNTNAIQRDINAASVANMQSTNALQAQLAQCCCDNKAAIAQVRYDMATDTCAVQNTIQNTTRDIIDNQNLTTRSILDFLVNDKIANLQSENQSLRLAASQAAQNQYLVNELRPCPIPAYITCSPYQSAYGIGLANCCNTGGCGCA